MPRTPRKGFRVLVSSAAADRIRAASELVRSHAAGSELLIVAPAREAADDFARQLAAGDGAFFGLHRFTLLQLAARFAEAELADRGLAPVSSLGVEAIAARATFAACRQERLRYFRPVARFPGFARALAATIEEVRLASIAPQRLPPLGPGGADLAALLELYAERLDAVRAADRAVLLRVAADAVGRQARPDLCSLPLVFLDVAVRSVAERDLVAALCAQAPAGLWTVPAGDDETLEALRRIGLEPEAAEAPADDRSSLARLRKYLFFEAAPPAGDSDEEVRIFSAPGEGRECVEIARQILDEARSGVAFDEIAVFVRAPETYSSLLATAFRRAGVPAYFARGTKRPDPAGRAFLALLACKSEKLSARRFAEYLSLGQVPRLGPDGAPPSDRASWAGAGDEAFGAAADAARVEESAGARSADEAGGEGGQAEGVLPAPWKWEDLLVEAAVIGGKDRWERRLDGLERQLELRRREYEDEEAESPRVAALERDLAHLRRLRQFALPAIELLHDLPAAADWSVWLEALACLAPTVLRRPQRVLRVLAELAPMAAVGPVSIEEVRQVLADRLSNLEEDPPESRFGHVFVGTPELARGRSFAVVFVPGLAERIFPQRPREDPLLLDARRKSLSDELTTQEKRDQRERLQLRLAVGAARARAHLSYPRVDVVEARPRVTSFYGLDVLRATTGVVPNPEQMARSAAAAVQARLAWPAPVEPMRAIDAVEHDLAVLDPLLHRAEPAQTKGRARYLFDLNPHLARSLRSRYARWQQRKWSSFDGLVGSDPAVTEALAVHRLNARPYSASALQRYATCPYQFLLSAIHRLEPREEAAALECMDPLTRGRLFHRVQAETLRALQARKLLPALARDVGTAEGVLDEILDAVASEYREELAPPILRVWEDEVEAIRTDLHSWLRLLSASSAVWEPLYFELGFGLPPDDSRDPASNPEPVRLANGSVLRGAIDLIERRVDGEALRVTDHKTGSDRTGKGLVIGGGETLQPVLYSLAVEAATGSEVTEARLCFCTSKGGFTERTVRIDAGTRRQGIEVLEIVDRAVASGVLPPAPREDACKICDFRVVCGPYEERRAAAKDPRLLADLFELRRRP